MKRIKDFSKVKVRPDMLFCRVYRTSKKIFIPEEASRRGDDINYAEVIAVGNKIDDVEVGDIILDVDGNMIVVDIKDEKGNVKSYGRIARHICGVIVSPDNFEK